MMICCQEVNGSQDKGFFGSQWLHGFLEASHVRFVCLRGECTSLCGSEPLPYQVQ